MPNCDWGKPCNCIDCRTNRFSIPCEARGFRTVVSYIMTEIGGTTDRKGLFSYNFEERTEENSEIDCYKCGHHMTGVPYYEKIEEHANELELNKKICSECGIEEYQTLKIISFKQWENKTVCFDCVEKKLIDELPNPSTSDRKFKIDVKTEKYVLDSVMIPCVTCGRKRWLKAENQWKKQCMNCYKKAL